MVYTATAPIPQYLRATAAAAATASYQLRRRRRPPLPELVPCPPCAVAVCDCRGPVVTTTLLTSGCAARCRHLPGFSTLPPPPAIPPAPPSAVAPPRRRVGSDPPSLPPAPSCGVASDAGSRLPSSAGRRRPPRPSLPPLSSCRDSPAQSPPRYVHGRLGIRSRCRDGNGRVLLDGAPRRRDHRSAVPQAARTQPHGRLPP